MATIVRTPAKHWKAVIRKQGWPTTTKTFRTKRDAEDWARRAEDEMVRGVFIERGSSERTVFASVLDRYLSEVTPTKRPATQRTERERSVPLREYFGKYSLAAINADLVARYRDMRLATPHARRKAAPGQPTPTLSPSTVRLELALLSHLFTTAIREWGLGLHQNPVANIRKPSPSEGRDKRITKGEEEALLAALARQSNPMALWIVQIAVETGMRSSEILGLRRDQVDLRKRVVRLRDTKNRTSRTVPLSRRATRVLEDALANPTRHRGCALVFFGEPGRDGVRRPYNFKKAWEAARIEIGREDLHFHDLRHEAVSRFVEQGLSDQEVAAISGHKSMQMLRRYTRKLPL
ncbi:site-specific integrase [Oleiagrimonas sp. MCCC 1A03011]|uniref:site-specific integrase n=1 Tax=Oleiagrimonas sp. MCCC 1A03011 TaxID=1926883 RepID=UPI000DC2B364|nr:site-specific integrase [Oleiagrimonas sp. MCCC 1A03011]RAP57282.1 integrase [Oleiagrimonas sp. MCCC 1A03011]